MSKRGWTCGYQTIESVRSIKEARSTQRFILGQGREVVLGARVLTPSASKPGYRVQALWTDLPAWKGQEGMRRVCIPPSMWKTLKKPRR